jgi:hypothetical protein
MTIDLTGDEIWFLKALRAAEERGCTVQASSRTRFDVHRTAAAMR